jgi:HD-GYP domain-containing protein (c-di-GMP phosphodiesterase class II)
MAPKIAAEKVAKLRGNQFDPEVVEALMGIWPDLDVPPHLRPLRARMAPAEQRSGPRVSECGEVYHVHD